MKKNTILMVVVSVIVVIILMLLDGLKGSGSKYIGQADGYGGASNPIKVEVSLDADKKITDIRVLSHGETDGIGTMAIDMLPAQIVNTQTVDVDNVAGASISSGGLKRAILDALASGGLDIAKYQKGASVASAPAKAEPAKTEPAKVEAAKAEPEKTEAAKPEEPPFDPGHKDAVIDVLVIGGGGAGMTSAIAAAEKGAHVVLLEKMPILGGNTTYSTGGINAANTDLQREAGITDDSEEIFYEDTMKGGHNKNNPELVKTLTENAKNAVTWLIERGMDLKEVGMFGGASKKRIHKPTDGKAIGPVLVAALKKKAEDLKIDIRLENKVIKLLKINGRVVGAEVDNKGHFYRIFAKSVIIATGGFGANPEMVSQYNPSLKGFGSTNSKGITGDGIKLVGDAGGQLVDMELIQTHPTVVHQAADMITEGIRGDGAILVNREGKRFINELKTRDVVSEAILAQTGGSAFLVYDQEVADKAAAYKGYVKFAKQGNTIEELAKNAGINEADLVTTMKLVAQYAENQSDPDFQNDKGLVKPLTKAPFYAIEISPAVHHTMGGVKINTKGEVLGADGNPVAGLFAAGEVTGGVHGDNRLGGNAVADIVVFGRIAGDNAADYAKSISAATDPGKLEAYLKDLNDALKEYNIVVELINDQLRLLLPGGLTFDVGSAALKEDFKKSLDAISVVLNKYPDTAVFVTGYTDNTGAKEANKKLSEDRAKSVVDYMISKQVDGDRFYSEGYGELHPVASNATDEGKAKNRRVEIRVLTSY